MKLLLVFPPFHTPASPPFGLAYLKGALSKSNPDATVRVQDWNLSFFKRWLMDEMPDICDLHPGQMLGQVCPSLLVVQGRGQALWDALTRFPQDEAEQMDYMRAAKGLDDIFNALGAAYNEILLPFIEQRMNLDDAAIERLFSAELAQVEAEAPDMIGFSILSEHNLLYALALGRVIKSRFDFPILLGGAMMAHLEAEELLMGFPWLDFVFSGEAEVSLNEFLTAWPNGELEPIAGLTHRIGTQACCHGQPAQLDLATLPDPDFSDYDLDGYLAPEPVLPIITSRGCYWGKCTFCSHALPYGGGVRVRKPDDVIAEMKRQMERYGVGNFLFVDEAISPRMLRHLSEGILSSGSDVHFGAEGIRVEEAFNVELLQTAYKSGLRWIYIGIESSIQRLLDLIEKGIKIEAIERLIETCRVIGIVPQLSFIVGLPTTTPEEIQQEIKFMQHYAVDSSTFVLLYGSPIYARPDLFGIRIEERETLYVTPQGLVHSPRFHFSVTDGLSPIEADWIVEAAPKGERMRPHLGEVHATLLAESGFFKSASRPDDLPASTKVAIQALQADTVAKGTGEWFLHMVSALEAEGRYQEAMTIAQSALGAVEPAKRKKLLLHIAAILNYAGKHKNALEILSRLESEQDIRAAALGEKLRANFALGNVMNTAKIAEALHKLGYEVPMSFAMLGFAYEQLGYYKKAIKALTRAEHRQYLTPELDAALARCHDRLKQSELAIERREKETRKRRYLGDLNPSTGVTG